MSPVALLDVNVLVALFDPDHLHHDAAHRWFAAHRRGGWATCPLTENGLVRVLSQIAYTPAPEPPARLVDRLRTICGSGGHVFWPETVTLRDARLFVTSLPISARQVTDVYLLGLARRRNARLATFDRSIPLGAVVGARPDHLEIIPV
jgi:uncharacterized protein